MSKADFLRNNRGINDGGDLPQVGGWRGSVEWTPACAWRGGAALLLVLPAWHPPAPLPIPALRLHPTLPPGFTYLCDARRSSWRPCTTAS